MFSHSCPSQVQGLSGRPHKEYGHILHFTICAWSSWMERHSEHHIKAHTGTHAMSSKLRHGVNIHVRTQDDDVLISWHRVGLAVRFCSAIFNVYIRTVGTNRACGSFTMQWICGWPIHSASWLFLNIICQTQCGVVRIKWQHTLYLVLRAIHLCSYNPTWNTIRLHSNLTELTSTCHVSSVPIITVLFIQLHMFASYVEIGSLQVRVHSFILGTESKLGKLA